MSESKIVWRKYPEEKPKKDGLYLITYRFGNKKDVAMSYLTKDNNPDNLIAWAEKPMPYDGPVYPNKDHEKLVFDEEKDKEEDK